MTVFAPSNEAFAAMSSELIGIDPDMLVGNHIVNRTVLSTQLVSMMRFENLAGTVLHSVAVSFYDYSLVYYYPQYLRNYHPSNLARTRTVSCYYIKASILPTVHNAVNN